MTLLWTEIRRHMRRRVIRVMILLAVLGCAFAGVVAFLASSGRSLAELQAGPGGSPALLTDWWRSEPGDSAVLTAAVFLLLGGFFAGAAVAGAEWRAGTVSTVLTWEPRRVRLNVARTAACGICAFVVGIVLQTLFLASFLPAVLTNGSTAGADGAWWLSLVLAIGRTALVTSIAAMLGAALATLGRNTAFALGVVFVWVAVLEGVIRGLRPHWAEHLWAENLAIAVQWEQIENVDFSRGPPVALLTIVSYTTVILVLATVVFSRRDVAGSS